jgi:hypothetical protein
MKLATKESTSFCGPPINDGKSSLVYSPKNWFTHTHSMQSMIDGSRLGSFTSRLQQRFQINHLTETTTPLVDKHSDHTTQWKLSFTPHADTYNNNKFTHNTGSTQIFFLPDLLSLDCLSISVITDC